MNFYAIIIAPMLFIWFTVAIGTERKTYKIELLGINSTTDPTWMTLNMSIAATDSVDVDAWYYREVTNPRWNVEFVELYKDRRTVYFSRSIDICTISTYARMNPLMRAIMYSTDKFSNFTLTCPIKSEYYYVRGFRLLPEYFSFGVFYRPGSNFEITSIIYNKKTKERKIELGRFWIHGRIIQI